MADDAHPRGLGGGEGEGVLALGLLAAGHRVPGLAILADLDGEGREAAVVLVAAVHQPHAGNLGHAGEDDLGPGGLLVAGVEVADRGLAVDDGAVGLRMVPGGGGGEAQEAALGEKLAGEFGGEELAVARGEGVLQAAIVAQQHPGVSHQLVAHRHGLGALQVGVAGHDAAGVLFGLNTYKYDFTGLLMHAEHLEATYGVGPHTISVPRICSADDINAADFENAISDEIFQKIVAIIRIAVPYTGMIISTRESQKSREKVLELGISQISGGSRTSVGGYAVEETPEENSSQFDISDNRTLDEIVSWLLKLGYIPSFCTACYREGRTGDRFMSLVKTGQIANCCSPNALMTLQEYLEDYASPETKALGTKMIREQMEKIPNPAIKRRAIENLKYIGEGKRDFRF